jgi:protein-L-isoaspartate(D-aspartate) O-methyltransferase
MPEGASLVRIQAWDRPAATFAYWPTGTDRPQISEGTVMLEKVHGLVTISWPAAS